MKEFNYVPPDDVQIPLKDSTLVKGSALFGMNEREIANYPAGPGVTIRIMVSGGGAITQKSIEKLIKHLELDKEYFPTENETKES